VSIYYYQTAKVIAEMFKKRIPYKQFLAIIAMQCLAIILPHMALPVDSTHKLSTDLKLAQSPLPILQRGRMISVCPPQSGIANEPIEFDNWAWVSDAYPEQLFPAHAAKKNRWGYLNKRKNFQSNPSSFSPPSEISILPQFATANLFYEGLASVSLEVNHQRSYGYINTKGQFVIQPQLKYTYYFSEGLAAIENDHRNWGYIDRSGRIVVKPQFDQADGFSEGLAAVKINQHWGYIDRSGKTVIKPKFDNVSSFYRGQAKVQLSNPKRKKNKSSWITINRQGQFIANIPNQNQARRLTGPPLPPIPTTNSTPSPEQAENLESKEWVPFEQNKKYGFKDLSGNIKIQPQFTEALYFSENRASVKIDEKWGYISRTGKLVIPAEFDVVGRFMKGYAIVKRGEEWGKINDFGDYECDFIP
jgi:hypothetical protein